MNSTMSHAEQDRRDASYIAGMNAIPRMSGGFSSEALAEQVRIGDLQRRNIEAHFPHMVGIFAELPALNKVG